MTVRTLALFPKSLAHPRHSPSLDNKMGIKAWIDYEEREEEPSILVFVLHKRTLVYSYHACHA